ncbi:pseudaminic acid cytidylyltransferase [Candidatus Saganbacteria bacterium]|nr:pseudaminic acid cytidylyltransferase [Candidatus Saganbacteria bacterium]
MNKNNSLAIITARGGSKRIPRKNIKAFLGAPIIKYSIETALVAGCFDEVMVSTDDLEIAEISKKYGARIPFIRSAATSDDYAATSDVLKEVIQRYMALGQAFEYFCCIYPTAPLISAQKLIDGLDLLKNGDADSVLAVTRYLYPIQRALKIVDGQVSLIAPENGLKRSQDLSPAYHDAGQFCWFKTKAFLNKGRPMFSNAQAIELLAAEVQDIDTEEDWEMAEIKYMRMQEKGQR